MGDEFAKNTIKQYYKDARNEDGSPASYLYGNFEVKEFVTHKHSNNCKNILSRMRNCLVTALNEHEILPKMIIFVMDDDVINEVNRKLDPSDCLTKDYVTILKGLMKLISVSINCYKDGLPRKAFRESIPHVIWLAPPNHMYFSERNNECRAKYTMALSESITEYNNMSVLRLVKHWDKDNSNLFLEEQYRYTAIGLKTYWMSVDAAIRFWNIALYKKFAKPKMANQAARPAPNSNEIVIKPSPMRDQQNKGHYNRQEQGYHRYHENNHNSRRGRNYGYRSYSGRRDDHDRRYTWERQDRF